MAFNLTTPTGPIHSTARLRSMEGMPGLIFINDSDGTFTFSDTTINEPSGTALNIEGGSSSIDFSGLSSISKNNAGTTINVQDGHNGSLTFGSNTTISVTGPMAGDGLQFSNADGTYTFDGSLTLDGGDAGIDIFNDSDGTFTFSDVTINEPSGTALNIDGGSSSINFSGLSSITKNNAGTTIFVQNGHNGSLTFGSNTTISVTGPMAGDGLQFSNADGTYTFDGSLTLDGGDAGIDIFNDSDGTFTFSEMMLNDPVGTAVNILGGSSSVTFSGLSSLTKTNAGTAINVQDGHDGSLTFASGTTVSVTGGGRRRWVAIQQRRRNVYIQ